MNLKVNYKGLEIKEFETNTTLKEISKSFKKYYNYPILVAKVDNNLTMLGDKIVRDCDVEFFDRSSSIGNAVYENTVQFILVAAVKRVFGDDIEVMIEHSMDNGVYCEIVGVELDKFLVDKIESTMFDIVKLDLKIDKMNVSRADAVHYFKQTKQFDKVKVMRYISNTNINLFRLENNYDYFYGMVADSTKVIDDFKLSYIRDNGFVLSYPSVQIPECTLEYKHRPMLFDTFLDYTRWGETLGIENAADLNECISTGEYDNLIRISEAYYDGQLEKLSEKIYENKRNIKAILMAGPTSSGKTTSSKKLQVYLRSKGIITHQISIDDYFFDRTKTPKDEYGNYDFESLKAIDLDAFNRDMSKLLDGERVLLPEYNFITGKREYKKKWLQLKKNEMIILEGLHAINEELTISIERRNKFKIYLSPLTQLNIDNHSRIHTSDIRKLRRIVRDSRTRGHLAADTLKQWDKIREGEDKYIYPFQDQADAILNTSHIYEISVLKTYAEPLLFSVNEDEDEYPEALRLINFLRNFLPMPSEDVPNDSVLREFIGNSCFYK